ncbi:hypothetical protein IWQ57_004992 [Coemansia nantahalensis]|uniref:Uncharacterized protein n=1 Tax=Coemansia nantahalensis TaxID=2789366 RepID=A0ACC1JQ39_9FUNG|nr:hypothetical protein IWQ57_004992 [Coemansia nantahalensis]
MSAFQDDFFKRRASMSFAAGPAGPRPLFGDAGGHKHFAYVAGCEICEDYVRRGSELCVHEHRVVCRGVQHGCCCHCCCQKRETTVCSGSGGASGQGYRAREEESVTDSQFGNGRVRARSATTMVGDADFGFANMDSEMLRMASDNRWRTSSGDAFYRPLSSGAPAPAGHVQLREGNFGQVFGAHREMHESRQTHMHAEAAAHFNGANRPMPLFGRYDNCHEENRSKKTTTTTTTTTTKTTRRPVPCEEVVHHPPAPLPPPPPPPPPQPDHHHHHHHHQSEKHDHHHHHHSHVPHIPVGVKPDLPPPKAEPCCTWCRFLPCFACPTPANPNERFRKENFRLYPEYEFLADNVEVAKPTEYFPDHTQVPTRNSFKVTIPKVTDVAKRVYVDFIGDQMVIIGEHSHGAAATGLLPRVRSLPSEHSTRTLHGDAHAPAAHVVRVFAKNFFVPRDTYDRNRAQAFVKPNGKLKIVVPALA